MPEKRKNFFSVVGYYHHIIGSPGTAVAVLTPKQWHVWRYTHTAACTCQDPAWGAYRVPENVRAEQICPSRKEALLTGVEANRASPEKLWTHQKYAVQDINTFAKTGQLARASGGL
jgi:hypothetical protein